MRDHRLNGATPRSRTDAPARYEHSHLPTSAIIEADVRAHRRWIEGKLGCRLSQALVLDVDPELGSIVVNDVLAGAPLHGGTVDTRDDEGDYGMPYHMLHEARFHVADVAVPPPPEPRPSPEAVGIEIGRYEVLPNALARIHLSPTRERYVQSRDRQLSWEATATVPMFALWIRGLTHPVVNVTTTLVRHEGGKIQATATWLLVNPAERLAVLAWLRRLYVVPGKRLTVIGGQNVPILGAYDWNDVVLSQDLTQLVREDFETFLEREAWFRRHRLPFRRGYLFYGPPGNGKTSVIKTMAAHPELLAYSIDFSREIDNQVLTKLFKSAADNAPALIVFEDLDRLYGRRKEEAQRDVNDNYTHITLQHLLNCLDGVGTRDGVIVVATANDVAALDPALLSRPGRFDRTVYFGPPSVELRAEYLRRLDAVQTLSPAAIARVAAACEGLSFAQVRDVYVLAGQRAFERSARGGSVEDVGDADLLAALEAKMTEMDDLKRSLSGRRVGFGRRSRDAGPA